MAGELEEIASAQDLCSQTLALMTGYEVPATPENYAVWYAYCAGTHPELTQMLDILMSNHTSFTPDRNEELHARFFSTKPHSDALVDTGQKLEQAMGKVVKLLGQAGADTSAYGRRLADLSGVLATGDSIAEVQTTVRSLIRETRTILVKNQELENRVERSAREIAALRKDLASVRRDALTDPLTGAANRKLFDQRLREGSAAAMETGGDLCLVLADIDHFKDFNDRFGHRVGDEVLKLVAHQLREQIKGRDTCARYGGEEFALVLPDTSLADSLLLADRIREQLSARALTSRQSETRYGRITLSAGVALYRYGEPLDRLIQRADMALYAAKHAGRNQVFAEPPLPDGDEPETAATAPLNDKTG